MEVARVKLSRMEQAVTFCSPFLIAIDDFVFQMQKQRQVDLWKLLQSKVVLQIFFFFSFNIKDSFCTCMKVLNRTELGERLEYYSDFVLPGLRREYSYWGSLVPLKMDH